jgi:hypothetical protein
MTFFFHEARDKIEVGFAVLDAVFAGLEVAVEAVFEIQLMFLNDLSR